MKMLFVLVLISVNAMAYVECKNKNGFSVKAYDEKAYVYSRHKKEATLKKDFEQDGRPYDGALIQGYSQNGANGYGFEMHTVHSRLLKREVISGKLNRGGVAGQTTVATYTECVRK